MGDVNGAALTNAAFNMAFPAYGSIILCVGLTLFAFTTILGWNYYGERCVEYLVGVKGILPYRIIFIALVACGAFIKLDVIWVLADIVNGLMAIPNLIASSALRRRRSGNEEILRPSERRRNGCSRRFGRKSPGWPLS